MLGRTIEEVAIRGDFTMVANCYFFRLWKTLDGGTVFCFVDIATGWSGSKAVYWENLYWQSSGLLGPSLNSPQAGGHTNLGGHFRP